MTSKFDKIDEDGHYDYSYEDKYLIKIVSEDKEYTKEVFGIYELSWITFEDVIGGEDLEGEFTLEISMPEIPIVKPYIQKMMFRD